MDRKRILPIFFIVFTNILGSGVIIPILPLVAEDRFQATAFQATALAGVFFAAQFIAAPLLGRISDRVGRRPVLIVSQIGTVLSFILFIFAAPLGTIIDGWGLGLSVTGGLVMLYVARILDGFTGGNITTAQAYITDISTPQTRAQALGIISAAFGMGFVFGPAFGGLLAEVSLNAPFIGAALITTVSVLTTTFMLKESLPPEARATRESQKEDIPIREFLNEPTIFLLLLITFIITLAFSALQSTFALYLERAVFPDLPSSRVARNAGLILTVVGIATVVTQGFLIKPLVKRFGERNVIFIGQTSLMITFGGLAVLTTPLMVTLLAIPLAFGNGVNQPSLQSLLTRFGSGRERGRLLGLYQSARSLALIMGPVWAGYVFQVISPTAQFAFAVPMLMVSLGLSFVLKRRTLPEPETATAGARS